MGSFHGRVKEHEPETHASMAPFHTSFLFEANLFCLESLLLPPSTENVPFLKAQRESAMSITASTLSPGIPASPVHSFTPSLCASTASKLHFTVCPESHGLESHNLIFISVLISFRCEYHLTVKSSRNAA